MTFLHPHWQATDNEQPVPVSVVDSLSAVPSAQPATVRTASRKPAAIVGILAVLGVGYAVFGGTILPGQVSDASDLTVRLTAEGAVPESLQVTVGSTVRWVNDDEIPHVITFDQLAVYGKPLETAPIFPGSSLDMFIPASTKAGTYSYVSQTSPLSGEIIIRKKQAQLESSSSPAQEQEIALPVTDTDSASSLSSSSADSLPAVPPEEPVPSPSAVVLPINFHTVDNPSPNPIEPLHSGAPLAAVTQHKPVSTPASGPAHWLLIAATSVAALFVTRKAFR